MTTKRSTADLPVAFIPLKALALEGRLGFCPAPGRWRLDLELEPGSLLDEDLAALCGCGASTLVVLLEEEEMERIGVGSLFQRASRAGLEVLWYPIPDGAAPSDMDSAALLVELVLERLASGRTVVVHCHGGIGRSGTIAASCLVAAGAEAERALAAVRRARPLAATAPGQEAFVRAFAAAWRQVRGGDRDRPGLDGWA
jgi:protein-tyrosine phosphatase